MGAVLENRPAASLSLLSAKENTPGGGRCIRPVKLALYCTEALNRGVWDLKSKF